MISLCAWSRLASTNLLDLKMRYHFFSFKSFMARSTCLDSRFATPSTTISPTLTFSPLSMAMFNLAPFSNDESAVWVMEMSASQKPLSR